MSIVLFPIKLILLIAAVIFKAATHIVAYVMQFFSGVLRVIGMVMCMMFGLGAVIGTIHMISSISDGTMPMLNGILIIAGFWVVLLIWGGIAVCSEAIADFISDIGDSAFDAAYSFMRFGII